MDPQELDEKIAQLVAASDVDGLSELARSEDKVTVKAARRGLHILRTRGVKADVPLAARRGKVVVDSGLDEPPPSVASMIDGRGERVVWYVVARPGGVRVCQAELSETRGLIGFAHADVSRKLWREQERRLLAQERLGVARVVATHVRRLIEEAATIADATPRRAPRNFSEIKRHLPSVVEIDEIEVTRAAIGPIDRALWNQTGALHDRPELGSWIPDEDALGKLDHALGEIQESQLIVDERQRAGLRTDAALRVLKETLSAELRVRLARRLEENAIIWHARGEDEYARLALAAADATRDEQLALTDNAFLRRLYDKLVPAVSEAPQAPSDDPGRLVVEPGSAIIQPGLPSRPPSQRK